MFNVKGSIVALITPFHEDGSVNFEKLGEILAFHAANQTECHSHSRHNRESQHAI